MVDAERLSATLIIKLAPSEKERLNKLTVERYINQAALVRGLLMKWLDAQENTPGVVGYETEKSA